MEGEEGMFVVRSWKQDQDQEKEMSGSLLGQWGAGNTWVFGLMETYNSLPKQDTSPLCDLQYLSGGVARSLCFLACPAD